jgi:hypothetical protein
LLIIFFFQSLFAQIYSDFRPKVGDQIEILGILEKSASYDQTDDMAMEFALPASVLPRLHCIIARPVTNGFPVIHSAMRELPSPFLTLIL